jgi:hypothetical protein
VPVGSPVTVGADGTVSLGPLTNLAVGTNQVTAAYSGTDQNAAATGEDDIVIGKAPTTTAIKVTTHQLTATVAAAAPGAGQPTGSVTFAVNGTTVGTVKISVLGVGVLSVKSSGAEVASANYGGDGACPAPVRLTHQGAALTVSRIIHGKDGGIATVVVPRSTWT